MKSSNKEKNKDYGAFKFQHFLSLSKLKDILYKL